jgi:hypothetical protein
MLITSNTTEIKKLATKYHQIVANANSVINAFNTYQNWSKIDSQLSAFNLIKDPIGYFDQTILKVPLLREPQTPRPLPSCLILIMTALFQL